MLLRIRMMAWKEFIQISRDMRTLGVVVVLPVVMLILYGYAINLDVKHLPMAVLDQDGSRASRDLIGAFSHGEYFDVTATLSSTDAGDGGAGRRGGADGAGDPARLRRHLAAGRQAQVQLLFDGSDSTTASTAIGYANGIVQQQSVGLALALLERRGIPARAASPLDTETRFWYNPELHSTNFIVPGLIAVILMMLAALLTSMTVVRERERGTIEQLIVSPVQPGELMLGKLLPYVAIAFFDILLVVAAGRLLFHVPLVGSAPLLLVLSVPFLGAALGIGLLISAVSPSQQTAMTLAFMTTLLPSILLSGFVFPVRAMPKVLQWFTLIIPARHFLVILRGIFLKGNGMELLWTPTLVLIGYAVLMLGLSASRFRKTL